MKKGTTAIVMGSVLFFAACNKNDQETQKLPASNAKVAANKMITIPVVVNMFYTDSKSNLYDAQIKSQIDVLNEAFSGTNSDYSKIPDMFKKVAAGDVGIRFVLQKVVRKQTTKIWESSSDSLKIPAQGGIKATNPTTALNVWIYPWQSGDDNFIFGPKLAISPDLDGIVMSSQYFGRIGYQPKINRRKGRTLVFLVGVWLNLLPLDYTPLDSTRDSCYRADDEVDDTPASYDIHDCPAFPAKNECTGEVMMTMNYMDTADDECRYMFTLGQKKRMLAALAKGGLRASFNK